MKDPNWRDTQFNPRIVQRDIVVTYHTLTCREKARCQIPIMVHTISTIIHRTIPPNCSDTQISPPNCLERQPYHTCVDRHEGPKLQGDTIQPRIVQGDNVPYLQLGSETKRDCRYYIAIMVRQIASVPYYITYSTKNCAVIHNFPPQLFSETTIPHQFFFVFFFQLLRYVLTIK